MAGCGLDRRRQRRKRQPGIDPSAERVACDAARPRIHDRGQVDEAAEDRDIGQIGDPELVRAIDPQSLERSGKTGSS